MEVLSVQCKKVTSEVGGIAPLPMEEEHTLVLCECDRFTRWSASGKRTVLRTDDRRYWSCWEPYPRDPARRLSVCATTQTVYELRTEDAAVLQKFPPCKNMSAVSISVAWHAAQATYVFMLVHESREVTVFDAAIWAPIARSPVPPFLYESDMPHATLDWSGEWVGGHVYCNTDTDTAWDSDSVTAFTIALTVWRVGGSPSEWVTGARFRLPPDRCVVDLIVPVPRVQAAWLFAVGYMILYARVDPVLGPVCDVVRGSEADFEPYAITMIEAIHPVSDTVMLIKAYYAPEYRGGTDHYVETWALPGKILADQGRAVP